MPLSQIATLSIRPRRGRYVWRRDRVPTVTVQADARRGCSRAVVPAAPAAGSRSCPKLPPGAQIEAGGTVEKSAKRSASVFAQVPLMMAADADRADGPAPELLSRLALVLSVAPLGLHRRGRRRCSSTGTPFGFIAILGIIALFGMIVRNSVILVDQIEYERARRGSTLGRGGRGDDVDRSGRSC